MSDRTKGTISYNYAKSKSASLSLKHIINPLSKLKHEGKFESDKFLYELLYKHAFTKKISLIGGGAIILNTQDTEVSFATNLRLAVAFKFSEHTKLSYGVEHEKGTLKLVSSLKRGGMNISIPIALSNNQDIRVVVLALAALGIASYFTKRVYNYVFSDEHPDAIQQKHTKRMEELRALRTEAIEYNNMIRDKVLQDRKTELDRKGLIINEAYYGRSDKIQKLISGADLRFDEYSEVIEVCLVLQFLVHDSKLMLTSASKSHISGMYNPCIKSSSTPVLYLKYTFGGLTHSVYVQDDEDLYIP